MSESQGSAAPSSQATSPVEAARAEFEANAGLVEESSQEESSVEEQIEEVQVEERIVIENAHRKRADNPQK